MTEALVVFCSFPCKDDVRQVGTLLVERGYAACINILPAVESIYSWEGELQRDEEVLMFIKTTRKAFPLLSRELKSIHPYDEPEIIALPVSDGSAGYLNWLSDTTRA